MSNPGGVLSSGRGRPSHPGIGHLGKELRALNEIHHDRNREESGRSFFEHA